MSIYSLGVMAERLVTYARANKASREYAASLRDLLPGAKFGDAVELSKKLKRGHLPKVLGLAIEEYSRGVEAIHTRGSHDVGDFDVIAAVNRAVERSSLRTVNDLRRGLGSLATIGSTAPFVGLLGTVWGIIKAFQNMAATGSGGLGTVSGAHRRGAHQHRLRPPRRDPRRDDVQLPHEPRRGHAGRHHRLRHRARRLLHEGRARQRGEVAAATPPPRTLQEPLAMSMDVGSKSVKSDINVTPLVDVVLVLLIIFMVITPMLQRGKPVPAARRQARLRAEGRR